jgi:PAS domain S-box-containing protein
MRKACEGVLRDRAARIVTLAFEDAGHPRWLEARIALGHDGHVLASLSNIDERFNEDARLRASEERFRVMADCAPVLLWRSDRTSDCDFFNRGWLEFTGRSMDQELGVGWTVGVHPEDFEPCMGVYMAAFVARQPFRMEYRLRRADGAFRWVLDQGVPRFETDGTFQGYIGSCIDVTDEREATRNVERLNGALQQRVREREVLLRELHHRVKNNLQLISSILNLQARLLEDPARQVLAQGQTRVRSIALVHEKLCDSETMSDLDLGEYTRDLIGALQQTIEGTSGVQVHVDIPSLPLAIDQAIPCGLIINELVTNALKHAFPGGRIGSVLVQARLIDAARLRLCVRDDGIGLPDAVDPRQPATLGMDLVGTLASQLGASWQVERSEGASFTFDFSRWKGNHASQ